MKDVHVVDVDGVAPWAPKLLLRYVLPLSMPNRAAGEMEPKVGRLPARAALE